MKANVRIDLDDERAGCTVADLEVWMLWESPDRSVGFSGGWTVDDAEVTLVTDDGGTIPYVWEELSKHDRLRAIDAAVSYLEEREADARAEARYEDGRPEE